MALDRPKILTIISRELDVPVSQLTDSARFADLPDLDPLDFGYLMIELEEELHIEIPESLEPTFDTVGHLLSYLERRVAA